jgi:hypothetical protein
VAKLEAQKALERVRAKRAARRALAALGIDPALLGRDS